MINEEGYRRVAFTYWQSLNSNWIFKQDLRFQFSTDFNLLLGFNFYANDLQKSYDLPMGPLIDPFSYREGDALFPYPPPLTYQIYNRINAETSGFYLQSNYKINANNVFHIGSRYDVNEYYENALTFRLGYVRHLGDFNFKVLFGRGYQEPSARELYGGWEGAGSNVDLKPQYAMEADLMFQYIRKRLSAEISLYGILKDHYILEYFSETKNSCCVSVYGLDMRVNYMPEADRWDPHFWVSYSYVRGSGRIEYVPLTDEFIESAIGDLAPHKFHGGLEISPVKSLLLNYSFRWISERETWYSNPIPTVKAFLVNDLSIVYRPSFVDNTTVHLRVKNLFNAHYFHPGIRRADGGDKPGYFDVDGRWRGSSGWYNSLLPQSGREIYISLRYRL